MKTKLVWPNNLIPIEEGEKLRIQPNYNDLLFTWALFSFGMIFALHSTPLYFLLWILFTSSIAFVYAWSKKVIILKEKNFVIKHNFRKSDEGESFPYSYMKEVFFSLSTRGDVLKIVLERDGKVKKMRYSTNLKTAYPIFHFFISKDVLLYIDDSGVAEDVFGMKEKDMTLKSGPAFSFFATGQTHLVKDKKE